MKKYILNIPNLLFLILIVLASSVPSRLSARNPMMSPASAFIAAIVLVEIIFLYKLRRSGDVTAVKDITAFTYSVVLLWELLTSKLDILKYIFVPAPENVFYVFVKFWLQILLGFQRSMLLLICGFSAALFFGVLLGILIGWTPRLRNAVFPVVKVFSTVPALIYTPYLVVMMPTFTAASILVIFLGIFWSTLMNTINDVGTVDKRIIDSAKVLNVKTRVMLFQIILPYLLPRIINSLSVQLNISVMTLNAAELIGADRGMGYFVKRSIDYANYDQAIAGIIFIAIVLTALNSLILLAKNKLIKWRY
jgi:NitT/TauT family transport system permease protein